MEKIDPPTWVALGILAVAVVCLTISTAATNLRVDELERRLDAAIVPVTTQLEDEPEAWLLDEEDENGRR